MGQLRPYSTVITMDILHPTVLATGLLPTSIAMGHNTTSTILSRSVTMYAFLVTIFNFQTTAARPAVPFVSPARLTVHA